jgi:hypothetical protein
VTGLRRGLALATLGAALLVAPSRLVAAERVQIVERGADCELSREFVTQLRAELEAAGFNVVVEAPVAQPALATVTCEAPGGTSISILIPRAGRDSDRRVLRAESNESAHSLVVRVTEFLRARVVEVTPPPPRREPGIAARPPVAPEPQSRAYSLELGASALFHPGGLAFSAAPAVALGVELAGPLWLELRAAGPFLGTENGGVGRAHLDQELALAGARFVAFDGVADVFVSAAVGAFRLGAKGEARPPFQSLSNSALSAAFAAGAGGEVSIVTLGSVELTLGARADAVLLAPEPALRLAETAVATAGQPACSLSATIGARW